MRGALLLAALLAACRAPEGETPGGGGGQAGVAGHSPGGAAGSGGAGSGTGGVASASGGRGMGSGGLGSAGDGGAGAGAGATGGLAGAPGAGGMASGGRSDAGAAGLGAAGRPGAGGQGASAGAGGTGGMLGDDRCSAAVLDPATPPALLSLTGNLGVHDPALLEVDGKFYLYATGRGLGAKTSTDLESWQGASAVFSSNPGWVEEQVPGATDLWAPDISYFGGQYHLYYSASTFGKNRSCIGHATRAALDSGSFTDHGSVFCSNVTTSGDDFNAIDPSVILDAEGTPWLTFGSFWGGIKQFKLTSEGTRADDELLSLADRPQNSGALEGPFIVRRCGYYYLFVSWGACCDGAYDYNMRVGRGTSVNGPFTDQAGKTMLSGGGTLLVEGNATWTAPGHNAVIFVGDRAYNVYHALNSSHQNPTLRVAELVWDDEGWPISAGP